MAVDDESDLPSIGIFVLRLCLGGSEPPSGTISELGQPEAHPFNGWIDLMSAINRLRGWYGSDLPPDSGHQS
jgi:hypothetical protein